MESWPSCLLFGFDFFCRAMLGRKIKNL
uniref:Uncharacterized protein n=1 Tax=Anguilla anguilla TaxID=7936 RepID=A0A0E9QLF5_ANGAN